MLHVERGVALLGTGRALPERKVTNAELRGLVRNYDEASGDFSLWVDRVTHIQERSWIDPARESAGSLGEIAARQALERSGVAPSEVDHLIFCSFTYNEIFPGEHVKIVRNLGMSCGAFQMTAACAGSIYGMALARSLVASGQCRNVLVVGVECLSRCTNFDDPVTAILFGDSAGAMLIGRKSDGADTGFLGHAVLRTEYSAEAIHMMNGNAPTPDRIVEGTPEAPVRPQMAVRPMLAMQGGPRVLKSAVTRMADAVVECLGFTPQDLKDRTPALVDLLGRVKVICHQANGRIVDGLQDRLGLARDHVYRTIYFTGNCSAATNPFTLDYAVREGNLDRIEPPEGSLHMGRIVKSGARIVKGDLVVMVSIGAGYSYGAMAFIHSY